MAVKSLYFCPQSPCLSLSLSVFSLGSRSSLFLDSVRFLAQLAPLVFEAQSLPHHREAYSLTICWVVKDRVYGVCVCMGVYVQV